MDRRTFIGTSLVTAMAGAYASGAEAAKDPHIEWLAEWKAQRAAWIELSKLNDDAEPEEVHWDRMIDAEDRLISTRAETTEGAAAQVELLLKDADGEYLDNRQTIALKNILTTLRRAS